MFRKTVLIAAFLLLCASLAQAQEKYYFRITVSVIMEPTKTDSARSWTSNFIRARKANVPSLRLKQFLVSNYPHKNGNKGVGLWLHGDTKVELPKILEVFRALAAIRTCVGVKNLRSITLVITPIEPLQ